jgi:hypothetical protein
VRGYLCVYLILSMVDQRRRFKLAYEPIARKGWTNSCAWPHRSVAISHSRTLGQQSIPSWSCEWISISMTQASHSRPFSNSEIHGSQGNLSRCASDKWCCGKAGSFGNRLSHVERSPGAYAEGHRPNINVTFYITVSIGTRLVQVGMN